MLTWGDDEIHTHTTYFTKIIRPRFLSRKDTSTIYFFTLLYNMQDILVFCFLLRFNKYEI